MQEAAQKPLKDLLFTAGSPGREPGPQFISTPEAPLLPQAKEASGPPGLPPNAAGCHCHLVLAPGRVTAGRETLALQGRGALL